MTVAYEAITPPRHGADTSPGDVLTGIVAGPVCGLRYQTPTQSGLTGTRGEFLYRQGEAVSFRVGGLVIGAVAGAPRVNVAQLVPRSAGKIDRLHDPLVTNLARLVQSLGYEEGTEQGVAIAPAVHEAVGPVVINFNQPDPAAFASDTAVAGLLDTLNATPGAFAGPKPRSLRGAAAARNELRRNIRGIVKMTDVKVPLRDGSFVLADVFRPAADGEYPVVMSKGFYGKSFYHECICGEADALANEALEDRFF